MDTLYDLETEQAVLGGILIYPPAYDEVAGVVKRSDFHRHEHRWIWDAMSQVIHDSKEIDIITVENELQKQGRTSEMREGAAYLTKLMNNVPSSLRAKQYAKDVAELARRRRLVEFAERVANLAHNSDDFRGGDLIDTLQEIITTNQDKAAVGWRDEWVRLVSDLERRHEEKPGEVWGLSYGSRFRGLDHATGGAHRSQFAILAGQPGVGKSLLAKDWAMSWWEQAPGAIYSLEMPASKWLLRAISGEVGVQTRDLMSGLVSGSDLKQLRRVVTNEMLDKPVYLSDHEEWTSTEIRADLTRLKREHGIEWAVIDYLQECSDAAENDVEASKKIAGRFRRTARALDIHLLTLSAVNKEGMYGDQRPSMRMLSGSGKVLHEADIVYWLNKFLKSNSEKDTWDMMSNQEKAQVIRNYRTFYILKGRHLPNPNMRTHMAFIHKLPKLAEAELEASRGPKGD